MIFDSPDGPEEIAMDVSGYIFTYVEWPHREVFFDGDNIGDGKIFFIYS